MSGIKKGADPDIFFQFKGIADRSGAMRRFQAFSDGLYCS